jgi:preprotein translocase subunit YajC
MFISPAFADDGVAAMATGSGGGIMQVVPLLLIVVVFYFMVLRPQTKRFQDHRKMVEGLKSGDKVVTGGGLVAKVVKLQGDDEVVLEIANGVQVTAVRTTIMTVKK